MVRLDEWRLPDDGQSRWCGWLRRRTSGCWCSKSEQGVEFSKGRDLSGLAASLTWIVSGLAISVVRFW